MKPSLQFSVPCLEVKEDNKPPTFAYLFYELPLPELSIPCPPFFINNGWCHGEGNFTQEVKILAPDKQRVVIETGKQTFALESPYIPQLIVNQFEGVEFKEAGPHWVQIILDSQLELEYPITVRIISDTRQPQKSDQHEEKKTKTMPFDAKKPIKPTSLNAPIFQEN